jgi:hypothetical protein
LTRWATLVKGWCSIFLGVSMWDATKFRLVLWLFLVGLGLFTPQARALSSENCPALDSLLDQIQNQKNLARTSNSAETIQPGAMAAIAECFVKQAASDASLVQNLKETLSSLPLQSHVTREQVASINGFLSRASSVPEKAAAFFAANSMIQVAESSKIFESRSQQQKVQETFEAITDYAERAPRSNPSLLVTETSKLGSKVDSVGLMASLIARRDMTASLSLKAKNYVRRIQEHKVAIPNGFDPGQAQVALKTVDELFGDINQKASGALSSWNRDELHREKLWLEDFDLRLMSAVQVVSPGSHSFEEAFRFWHSELKSAHPKIEQEKAEVQDPEILIDLASDQVRSEIYETTQAIRRAIPEIKKQIQKSSSLVDRSYLGNLSQVMESLVLLDRALEGAGNRVRRMTDPEEMERAWLNRNQLKLISTWALEASLSKSRTVEGWVSVLNRALSHWGQKGPFLSTSELHQIHQVFQDQNAENWVRAFINRQMAVVYAHSVLLLGEAISVPFTWGGTAAAMPTTLHAIVVGLEVAGKTTLILSSSLNIADRYLQDGVKGLVNPSSALDALTIVMMLPRPIPGPVDAQTWWGKALQQSRNQAAGWMHEASRMAIVGHAAFGAYQLALAEHIAATLKLQGYQTSVNEVRRQALGHLAQAFLLGMVEWQEYQRGQALGGDSYSQMIASKNPVNVILHRLRNMVFPHKAAAEIYQSLAPVVGAPVAGVAGGAAAAGYLAYDYIVASESLMYFYAGSDVGYFAHNRKNQEYPELQPGQSAVTFIGFDEADMLYAGSHAIDSHRVEMEKYGKNYFIYDYSSREDFLQKLAKHAQTHGPIKYLRIMTHGLPGKLYTGDVAAAAVDETSGETEMAQREGWIDASWLRKNSERIRKVAGNSLAPEARVVLFACLVGANLDSPLPGLDPKAGDEFLKALGETLVFQGGLIDASIRFLIGLDTVYGSLMNWAARDEFIRSGETAKHQPLVPIALFQAGKTGLLEAHEAAQGEMAKFILAAATGEGLVAAGDDESGWSKSSEMAQFAVSRMWRMLTQLHKLGIRYGIQLEGPWWNTPRYKHAKVTPAVDGRQVVVDITTY